MHAVHEVCWAALYLRWAVLCGLQVLLRVGPGRDEARDRVAAHSGECAVTDGWDLRSAGVASSTVTGIRSCARPHPSPKG